MREISVHIIPSGERWQVRRSGSAKAWRVFPDIQSASWAATRLFPNHHLRIYRHDTAGRIVRRVLRAKMRAA